MFKYPKVTVLILSFNGIDLLFDSITSYLNNNYPNFDVIVIDNGSTDGTEEFVKNKWNNVRVLRTEINLKYSGGFNFGLDFCFNENNADYVLITNNDVKVDENVITELVKVSEANHNIGFTTGKVYYYDQPNILQTVGKYEDLIRWNGPHIGAKEFDKGQYDEISERHFIDDIYMLVKKRVYSELGGYDTNYEIQCEEWDWQARAKKHGIKMFYTPFAKLWHKESMTIGKKSSLKGYYDTRNPIILIYLHKNSKYFKRFILYHFWSHVIKASIKAIILDFNLKKFFKIWLGFYDGCIFTIRKNSTVYK